MCDSMASGTFHFYDGACHTDIQLASISTRLALLIFRSNLSFMCFSFFVFFPLSGGAQLVCLCTKAVLALGLSNHIRIDFGQDSKHHSTELEMISPPFHVTWVVWSFCLLLSSHSVLSTHLIWQFFFFSDYVSRFSERGFNIHVPVRRCQMLHSTEFLQYVLVFIRISLSSREAHHFWRTGTSVIFPFSAPCLSPFTVN